LIDIEMAPIYILITLFLFDSIRKGFIHLYYTSNLIYVSLMFFLYKKNYICRLFKIFLNIKNYKYKLKSI
jgi:hypothetical protein